MKRRSTGNAPYSRDLMIVTGIAVLLWSSLEDNDAMLVTILGALLAIAATMTLFKLPFLRARFPSDDLPKRATVAGALVGTLASVTTPLLMLFKDLRHAHVFPDYPPGMMLAMLERMPMWALAGGLAGFGFGLLLKLGSNWRSSR